MKAPTDSGSSGNSRKMNFALPASTYLALIAGQASLWKAAQWLQVREAYSMIVASASARPSTTSGSACGAASAWMTAGDGAAASASAAAAKSAKTAKATRRRAGMGDKLPPVARWDKLGPRQ